MRSHVARAVTAAVVALVAATVALVPAAPAEAAPPPATRVVRVTGALLRTQVRELGFAATHVALYWKAHPDAHVSLRFSRDGVHFGSAVDAGRDEVGEQRGNGITYGVMLPADGARFVQVRSDRHLGRVTVLGLAERLRALVGKLLPRASSPIPASMPSIISRAGWGADESLRFDSNGHESWPPAFSPVQKLIVHHTAGANNDPNPAATVRAIYYYHAITQGWGDIGYNFLIDEAGHIYKGRDSHPSGRATDTITGEDASGNGVTGAHAKGYNAGAVGVALLGTLSDQDATPAAKYALEDLLAWKAQRHSIDPHGATTYTNPTNGDQRVFANIAGHRDVGTTECPGGAFYATLPSVRDAVAARMTAHAAG